MIAVFFILVAVSIGLIVLELTLSPSAKRNDESAKKTNKAQEYVWDVDVATLETKIDQVLFSIDRILKGHDVIQKAIHNASEKEMQMIERVMMRRDGSESKAETDKLLRINEGIGKKIENLYVVEQANKEIAAKNDLLESQIREMHKVIKDKTEIAAGFQKKEEMLNHALDKIRVEYKSLQEEFTIVKKRAIELHDKLSRQKHMAEINRE